MHLEFPPLFSKLHRDKDLQKQELLKAETEKSNIASQKARCNV